MHGDEMLNKINPKSYIISPSTSCFRQNIIFNPQSCIAIPQIMCSNLLLFLSDNFIPEGESTDTWWVKHHVVLGLKHVE